MSLSERYFTILQNAFYISLVRGGEEEEEEEAEIE